MKRFRNFVVLVIRRSESALIKSRHGYSISRQAIRKPVHLLFASILAVSCSAFGETYTIQTVAGGGLPENVAGAPASLGRVSGVAVDAAGNVLISLADYSLVLRLDATSGNLTPVAGNGTVGYSGEGGPATGAQLANPQRPALDTVGNLYIVDSGNNRVRELSGGVITTVAGNGPFGYNGDNIPATSSSLASPAGVAVDASGHLYIAETSNHGIRKAGRGVITTVAGNAQQGYNGDGLPATSAELNNPVSIVLDANGNSCVADVGTVGFER
jgi:NHL repeat